MAKNGFVMRFFGCARRGVGVVGSERSTLLRRARTFLRRSTRATDANTDAFSGVRGGNAGFVIPGKRGKQKMDARLRTSIIITQIKRFAKKFSAKTGGAIFRENWRRNIRQWFRCSGPQTPFEIAVQAKKPTTASTMPCTPTNNATKVNGFAAPIDCASP